MKHVAVDVAQIGKDSRINCSSALHGPIVVLLLSATQHRSGQSCFKKNSKTPEIRNRDTSDGLGIAYPKFRKEIYSSHLRDITAKQYVSRVRFGSRNVAWLLREAVMGTIPIRVD